MKNILKNKIYAEIGVSPIINAAGTKSAFGGSKMSNEVLDAIREASRSFVDMSELNQKIGNFIAEVTDSEAGMVTSGAASGVVLSIAACMTGTDIHKIRKLPNACGMKNEVIIQKIHRGSYSHMYTFTGAKFVEIGDINDCLVEELEGAITPNTAAIAYLLGPRISRVGLSLKQMVALGKKYNIPVIVDAAAMLPPKENLKRFIQEGADLVVISGGKMIHGPQSTGIMFGKKELIKAALANASPNHAIGRPHKVSKEDMVGLYVALKNFIASDENKQIKDYMNQLIPIQNILKDVSGINLKICKDNVNYNVPTLVIQLDSGVNGITGRDVVKKMREDEPRVFMQFFAELDHLVISPISLQEGEAEIVGGKLKKIFLGMEFKNECAKSKSNIYA